LFCMRDALRLSDAAFGLFSSISALASLPSSLLYARVCRRYALRPLLPLATLIAVPQMLALLFVRSPAQAMVAGALMGLLGGIANSAYLDLYLRSCPKRLEGTTMTLANAIAAFSGAVSNLLGAWIYTHAGFAG